MRIAVIRPVRAAAFGFTTTLPAGLLVVALAVTAAAAAGPGATPLSAGAGQASASLFAATYQADAWPPHNAEPRLVDPEMLSAEPGEWEPGLASPPIPEDIAAWENPAPAWSLQFLPGGLIYPTYLAGAKESRFTSAWMHDRDGKWMWDISLGGRAAIVRYGSADRYRPEGVEIDIEGAGQPRLDLDHERDVMATDFRFGVPITFGGRRFQTKVAYYHISSHLGDEFMLRFPDYPRINYVRDELVLGQSYFVSDALRLYAEAGWAFYADGGAEPWELQFGADFAPARPGDLRGAPFVAVNGHLREEFDYGGNVVVQTGWHWRGEAGHLFRMGMHYYAGHSDQYEFFDRYEEKLGMALWYDY